MLRTAANVAAAIITLLLSQQDLRGVSHVQRFVMERLFWPKAEMVPAVEPNAPWVQALRHV